jgi:hypothetical protein
MFDYDGNREGEIGVEHEGRCIVIVRVGQGRLFPVRLD